MLDPQFPDHDPELFDAIEQLYFAYRAFTARPDAILHEQGLARLHHRILYFVARRPGLRMNELLATLAVSKQALHGPLRQLQMQALVRLEADAQDKRGRCVFLTEAGAALEQRLSATQQALLARVLGECGPEARQGWHAIMQAIAASTD